MRMTKEEMKEDKIRNEYFEDLKRIHEIAAKPLEGFRKVRSVLDRKI